MKKILAFLAALVAVFSISLVVASPAQAAKSQCATGRMCFWWDAGYGNLFWSTPMQNAFSETCVNIGGLLANEVSSMWYNRGVNTATDDQVRFFNSSNCSTGTNYATVNANSVDVSDLACPIWYFPACNSFYNDNFASFTFKNHGW